MNLTRIFFLRNIIQNRYVNTCKMRLSINKPFKSIDTDMFNRFNFTSGGHFRHERDAKGGTSPLCIYSFRSLCFGARVCVCVRVHDVYHF